MAAYDMVSDIDVVNAVNSAALSNDSADSAAIDTAGYESVTVVAQMAEYTSGGAKITLTECDTSNGTFTAVAAEDLIGSAVTMNKAGAVAKLGYRGHKQFLKVKISKVSSISATVGALVILGHPKHKPVA